MLTNPLQYASEDFVKLDKTQITALAINKLDQAGYWSNVYSKLISNPRANFSIIILLLLISFSLFGPLFWAVNPAEQDLTQISQGPSFNKRALVIDSGEFWEPEESSLESINPGQKMFDLKLAIINGNTSIPHTESVKLMWASDQRADSYEIYRHILKPSGEQDLGLPLGESEDKLKTFYEDRLQVEARTYFYSVLALDPSGERLAYETLKVDVQAAVPSALAEKKVESSDWKLVSDQGQDYVILKAHPMGTDYLGRDMMARLMWGGKTSLLIGFLASLFFVLFGALYGALSAYTGGTIDNVLMRFADFVIALPFLLFMILLKVSFGIGPGESGIGVMIFSLIILSWPSSARLVRGQVLLLKEQAFVLAARINGASLYYVLSRHLLPNVLSVILVSLSFAIPSVILTEAFLSFIGLGVVAPTPSWGAMCQDGIKTFLFHPHELIFPAAFIAICVLAFNLLGDALRDALDVQTDS